MTTSKSTAQSLGITNVSEIINIVGGYRRPDIKVTMPIMFGYYDGRDILQESFNIWVNSNIMYGIFYFPTLVITLNIKFTLFYVK